MNRNDVLNAVNRLTFHRGEAYFRHGQVRKVEAERQNNGDILLSGSVVGSEPYQQRVTLELQPHHGTRLQGQCSCPVGRNCKHVVAVCLEFVARLEATDGQMLPSASDRWLDALIDAGKAENNQAAEPAEKQHFLTYVIDAPELRHSDDDCEYLRRGLQIQLRITREKVRGGGLNKGNIVNPGSLQYSVEADDVLNEEDRLLLPLLTGKRRYFSNSLLSIDRESSSETMERLLNSGRAYWQSLAGPSLRLGEARQLSLHWELQQDKYRLKAHISPSAHVLLLRTPWYLDVRKQELGPLIPAQAVQDAQWPLLLEAPEFTAEQAQDISERLMVEHAALPVPPPVALHVDEIIDAAARPCINLIGFDTGNPPNSQRVHAVELRFRYADLRVDPLPETPESTVKRNDTQMIRIQRDLAAEQEATILLEDLGLQEVGNTSGPRTFVVRADNISLMAAQWQTLLEDEFPRLQDAGWEVSTDNSFTMRFDDADLDGEVESGIDWFALRYDLDVDGEKYPLAPLIAPLIDSLLHQPIEQWPEKVPLHLGQGRFLRVAREKLRPALEVLRELYNPEQLAHGELKNARHEAAALAALDHDRALRGARELVSLAKRLRDFQTIEPAPLPKGLVAELRPYQQQGLSWLQFLREYGFNGILADDMGLGKTLQTLTHLLLEKEQGRLDKPALVIAPTSLMGNWRREAERFTPDLKVLVLHGSDRHRLMGSLHRADIILSTYPLLSRDADVLGDLEYHYLILDEAQNVKNPKTRAARVIRDLKTRHRLCLTGTPMENHLGELWSLFDFLMPGFLFDERSFRQHFRGPIENENDPEIRRQLSRRVQPFLLRRTKDSVVRELPPKTEILRTANFDKSQAQLYESIRVSMDKRVREAIAAHGLARSHITILDALLKLRQTCCDPRLLKLDAARKVRHSAKLELLMDMLPELLEEGRRILLFSQFTQMLALIEDELQLHGIEYSKLTGQTRKRDDAIARFTDGEVNVFLISLKAGGVGLNLPEADTVILYDPWWNPAVEAQAADRAHRIGQSKPVFVYKLLVENSVEETILGLQEHKRALADAIYSGESHNNDSLVDAESLQALFSPLGYENQ